MELVRFGNYEIDIEPFVARANEQLGIFETSSLPVLVSVMAEAIREGWTPRNLRMLRPEILTGLKPSRQMTEIQIIDRMLQAVSRQAYRNVHTAEFENMALLQESIGRKLKVRVMTMSHLRCGKATRREGKVYDWHKAPRFPLVGCTKGVLCSCSLIQELDY